MRTILLVEDEQDILENNRHFFEEEGYRALAAENLAQARTILATESPGAIVLDIMLPDGNGLDLLVELRASGNKVPIIMLTAWGKSSDVARGLNLGANDYVTKPFTYEILQARLEAMFRNIEQIPDAIKKGAITLKIRTMEAQFGSRQVKLPPVEFHLLELLMENEGRAVKAEYLYEKVWGAKMQEDFTAIRNTISRLRKKIEGSGYLIESVYGGSYLFERDE